MLKTSPNPVLLGGARLAATGALVWVVVWMREWWQHVRAGHGSTITLVYIGEAVLLAGLIASIVWAAPDARGATYVRWAALGALAGLSFVGGFSIGAVLVPAAFILFLVSAVLDARPDRPLASGLGCAAVAAVVQAGVMFAAAS